MHTVSFFGGPAPSDALLNAAAGHTVRVRVRPDLLDRATASRLAGHGVRSIELDALTFHDPSLRAIGRRYPAARLETMLEGLDTQGFEVGIVLAIGLPHQSHALSLEDAERCVGRVHTVRLHPVLVLREAALWEAHLADLYDPLTLGQAVTTARAMMDLLEPAGVRVIRVGQQPGPDGLGRAMAGPYHPSLRELVEALRTLDHLRELMPDRPADTVVIRCATADETRARGPMNDNVRKLRAEFGLRELLIRADPSLDRGCFVLEAS